ncbi:MAG: energy transducer TonB family protein [Candidatus Longimicrobiales bacterium M2_2A_002]
MTDPRPISVESPYRYPIDEWDGDVEGEVTVMVHVTAVGDVDSVYVLESSGEPALDSAALAGTRELEFAPGRRGDERIAMWAKLPVRFATPDSVPSGGEE